MTPSYSRTVLLDGFLGFIVWSSGDHKFKITFILVIMRSCVSDVSLIIFVVDPIVDSWLFMKSPLPVVTILVTYLYFVLVLGPKLMEKRKAYELKGVMIAYNAYQVLFSLWLCSQAFKVTKPVQLLGHTCKNPSKNREFQDVVSSNCLK